MISINSHRNKWMISIILFLLTAFIPQPLKAQEGIPFIDESVKILMKLDDSGEIPTELKQFYGWYQRDMATCEKESYYPEFTERITRLSLEKGVFFTVTFATDKEGAKVKYQTVFDRVNKRPPLEANNPTNRCVNKLPMGYYYVWCERDGKPTSDTEKKIYVYNKDTIVLVEK
jgi:hypothetical protein